MPLTTLPNEILLEVLKNLHHRDLLQSCLTCRLLKKTVDTYAELQYILELGRDGMVDTDNASLSHAERLVKLRDRRKAWQTLSWKTQSVVGLTGVCQAYELVGGLFVKATGGKDFLVSWLPSATESEQGHQLLREDLGLRARDFAIDPTQDLIVFMEDDGGPFSFTAGRDVNIHIRTVSTHEAHPAAFSPVVRFYIRPSSERGNFIRSAFLQLADDILAVFISTGPDGARLLLCNWKAGCLILDSEFDGIPRCTWDFSFLNSRAYIITSYEDSGSIHIYSFTSTANTRPIHAATLCLPSLCDDVTLRYLSTHTGPYYAQPLSGKPFTTSPSPRVHVLSMQYLGYNQDSFTNYCVFVHNHTFLKYITSSRPTGRSSLKGRRENVVDWEQWGPKNTRFLVRHVPFTWLRFVQGQRVVCPPTEQSSGAIQILDFNLHTPAEPDWHVVASNNTFSSQKTWMEPTRLAPDNIFRNEVVTWLPYRLTSRTVEEGYSAFMIDEERVIGLKAEGYEEEEIKELHIFTF